MSGDFPPVVIKKFFFAITQPCVAEAQEQLNEAIGAAFPTLDLNQIMPPTLNDIRRSTGGIPVFREKRLFIFCAGTTLGRLGPHLLTSIEPSSGSSLSSGGLGKQHFMQAMMGAIAQLQGIVVIGQTPSDIFFGGTTIGRRSDLFSYLLCRRAQLDRQYVEYEEIVSEKNFLFEKLMRIGENGFADNGIVEVKGIFSGSFLRRCFRELSKTISKTEFLAQFGEFGLRWFPRFP